MTKYRELSETNSCFNKALDTELMFIVLERDAAAPGTIRDWINRRIRMGLNKAGDAKLVEAEVLANQIEGRLEI